MFRSRDTLHVTSAFIFPRRTYYFFDMCLIFFIFSQMNVLYVVYFSICVNSERLTSERRVAWSCFSDSQVNYSSVPLNYCELLCLFVISIQRHWWRSDSVWTVQLHHGWHTIIQRWTFFSRMQVLWINTIKSPLADGKMMFLLSEKFKFY